MTQWLVRALLVGGVVALAIGSALLWERGSEALDEDPDAPIASPSRLRVTGDGVAVEIPPDDAARMGLRLAAVATARALPRLRLPGELVPDPERTTAIRAPLTGRLSVPPGGRWPGYADPVAQGELLAQISDAMPLEAPRAGVVTAVGAQPGEMVSAGQLLLELTDYGRPLARIAWTAALSSPPRRIEIEPAGPAATSTPIAAELIGAAPQADPVTRLPAYLYRLVRGWRGARPGLAVTALVPAGPPGVGVLVPDRALVQWDGLLWAYVRQEPGRYIRRRVPTDRPAPGGFLATAGWEAGDSVVVTGAEQLLSEEFRARVTVGDEQGE